MAFDIETLGQALIDSGTATQEQINEAVQEAQANGVPIEVVLAQKNIATAEQIHEAVSMAYGMPFVTLDYKHIPEDVLDLITPSSAELYRAIPFNREENGAVSVAMADLENLSAVDTIRYNLGVDVTPALTTDDQIEAVLEGYYRKKAESLDELINDLAALRPEELADDENSAQAQSGPVVKLLELILVQAVKDGASDVHFEPFEDVFKIRYRVDGSLYELVPPPKSLAPALASRIKVMAGLKIAERRLLRARRMREFAVESRYDALVFSVGFALVTLYKVFDIVVDRAVFRVYRNASPRAFGYAVGIRIYRKVESADLVRTRSRLYNVNTVHHRRFVDKGVRMAADDYIDAPFRIELRGELLVFFKADVRKQNRQIDIERVVSVTDPSDLVRRLVDVYERSDKTVVFRLVEHLFRKYTDEKYLHAVDLFDKIRTEKARVVSFYVEVCVYYREFGAFFKEKQMRYAVVYLVVAERDHVRRKHIHYFNRGNAFEFGVYDRSAEHIAGDAVQSIGFFFLNFVYVARQHRNAAYEIFVDSFGEKVAVHIVRVEKHQLFVSFVFFHFTVLSFR